MISSNLPTTDTDKVPPTSIGAKTEHSDQRNDESRDYAFFYTLTSLSKWSLILVFTKWFSKALLSGDFSVDSIRDQCLSRVRDIPQESYRAMTSSAFSICLMLEGLVFVIIVLIFGHRILGYCITMWLRKLLATSKGAFMFEFGWIALRLGLDQNEIVISDYVWRNPPRYRKTPFLFRVRQLTLRFDIWTVFNAIYRSKPMKIQHLEIDSLDFYVERGAKGDCVNMWAAFGSESLEESTTVAKLVQAGLLRAMSQTFQTSGNIVEEAMKNLNPAKMVQSFLTQSNETGEHFGSVLSARPPAALAQDDLSLLGVKNLWQSQSQLQPDSAEQSPLFSPWLTPRRMSEQQPDGSRDSKAIHSECSPDEDERPPEPYEDHWYVPYRFDVNYMVVRDLRLYAQDYLNAEHSVKLKDRPIDIPFVALRRKELTDEPYGRNTDREAVYLDELTWKLIGRLLQELMYTNRAVMTTLLASAAASQTKSTVTGAVENVTSALTENTTNGVAFVANQTSQAVDNVVNVSTKATNAVFTGANNLSKGVMETTQNVIELPTRAFKTSEREEIARLPVSTAATAAELGLHKLSVRCVSAHGLGIYASACYCRLVIDSNITTGQVSMRTTSQSVDTSGNVDWGETLELAPVSVLEGDMLVQVYEQKSWSRDVLIGELTIDIARGVDKGDLEEFTKGSSRFQLFPQALDVFSVFSSQSSRATSPLPCPGAQCSDGVGLLAFPSSAPPQQRSSKTKTKTKTMTTMASACIGFTREITSTLSLDLSAPSQTPRRDASGSSAGGIILAMKFL